MLNKILANKKIVIATITLFLALCVGIIIIASNSKKIGEEDTDVKTEQNKEDVESKDDKEETDANDKGDDNSGLEVIEPDKVAPEDSSDASGSWGDTLESNTQTVDKNTTDKIGQAEKENSNDGDNKEDNDEDILEDDIAWGNIY